MVTKSYRRNRRASNSRRAEKILTNGPRLLPFHVRECCISNESDAVELPRVWDQNLCPGRLWGRIFLFSVEGDLLFSVYIRGSRKRQLNAYSLLQRRMESFFQVCTGRGAVSRYSRSRKTSEEPQGRPGGRGETPQTVFSK